MIDLRVDNSWSRLGFNVWIIDRRPDNACYIAKPTVLDFAPIEDGHILPEPTFFLNAHLAKEVIPALRRTLAGITWFEDKEDYEASKRIEKAMQAHIDSLKLVVDRVVK